MPIFETLEQDEQRYLAIDAIRVPSEVQEPNFLWNLCAFACYYEVRSPSYAEGAIIFCCKRGRRNI